MNIEQKKEELWERLSIISEMIRYLDYDDFMDYLKNIKHADDIEIILDEFEELLYHSK